MDRNEVFADGMGEITLSGGMVRIDLVTLSSEHKDDQGRPQLAVKQRIIMPPDGFLRSFSAMEDLVKKLMEAGLVKSREGEGTNPAPAASATIDPPEPPKSPNFGN